MIYIYIYVHTRGFTLKGLLYLNFPNHFLSISCFLQVLSHRGKVLAGEFAQSLERCDEKSGVNFLRMMSSEFGDVLWS